MKRVSQYAGISVIDGENGSLIGICEYITVLPGDGMITGVRIKPKGIFKRSYYLDRSAVKVFGDVSIIIDSNQNRFADKSPSPIDTCVYDSAGGLIGYISDCFFNENDGCINEFEIRHGIFDDLIYGRTRFSDYSIIYHLGEPAFITDYSRLKGAAL